MQFLNADVGVETCSNLITLAPSVHEMWRKAAFALSPVSISKGRRNLIIQVMRLPKYRRSQSINILQRHILLEDYNDKNESPLYHARAKKLCSLRRFNHPEN
jgi:hypothetical protein